MKNQHDGVNLPRRLEPGRKPVTARGNVRKQIKCALCNRTYSTRQGYFQHRRQKHQQTLARPTGRVGSAVQRMEFNSMSGRPNVFFFIFHIIVFL